MPFKGGLVHAGMLASAQWFFTNIVPQIFRYVVHHSKDITGFIITGHSLGGGTASLVTMMVLDQLEKLRKLTGNPSFRIHCYSYAPVALASHELNHKFDDYIHSFICHDDIVGRMSYGTAMQLKELIMDTISAYDTLGGWYKVMTDQKKQKLCFEIISRCRDQIYQSADKLYPLVSRRKQNKKKIKLGSQQMHSYIYPATSYTSDASAKIDTLTRKSFLQRCVSKGSRLTMARTLFARKCS